MNGMLIHELPDIAGSGRVGVPTTVVAMSVSHCTTPLNFDMPALTLTMPAVTSIWPPAVTVTFSRGVDRDPAALKFDRIAVAVLNRDGSRPVLERDLLAAGRFNNELLLPRPDHRA